jgi:hypothetical protein
MGKKRKSEKNNNKNKKKKQENSLENDSSFEITKTFEFGNTQKEEDIIKFNFDNNTNFNSNTSFNFTFLPKEHKNINFENNTEFPSLSDSKNQKTENKQLESMDTIEVLKENTEDINIIETKNEFLEQYENFKDEKYEDVDEKQYNDENMVQVMNNDDLLQEEPFGINNENNLIQELKNQENKEQKGNNDNLETNENENLKEKTPLQGLETIKNHSESNEQKENFENKTKNEEKDNEIELNDVNNSTIEKEEIIKKTKNEEKYNEKINESNEETNKIFQELFSFKSHQTFVEDIKKTEPEKENNLVEIKEPNILKILTKEEIELINENIRKKIEKEKLLNYLQEKNRIDQSIIFKELNVSNSLSSVNINSDFKDKINYLQERNWVDQNNFLDFD